MRVLFVNRWVGRRRGGTETYILELARVLKARGHEVSVVTSAGKLVESFPPGIEVYQLSHNRREGDYSDASDIRTLVFASLFVLRAGLKMSTIWNRQNGPFDVILVHSATEAALMWVLRPLLRVPYVYVFAGYSRREARIAKCSNLQLSLSHHVQERVWQDFGYRPVVIPVGTDVKRFGLRVSQVEARQHLGLPRGGFIVLTVCSLVPHKDLDTLIAAANLLDGKLPGLLVVVVGDGPERSRLARVIQSQNLEDRVSLAGPVVSELLPFFYCAANVFALTEVNAGFSGGIVFLEAMSAGVPIIATNVGGIPETVEGVGALVPPGNPEDLSGAILGLAHNETLRNDMKQKGLEKVKSLDWDTLIERYEDAFRNAIANYRSAQGLPSLPPS